MFHTLPSLIAGALQQNNVKSALDSQILTWSLISLKSALIKSSLIAEVNLIIFRMFNPVITPDVNFMPEM